MSISGAIATLFVDFRADGKSLNTDLKNISKSFGSMGRDFDKLGKSLSLALTVPLAAAGKKIFDAADSYQKATRKIQVGTGATGKALVDLTKNFEGLAGEVPNQLNETAAALTQVSVRTGLTGTAAANLAKNFLNLSNITETDLNTNLRSGLQLFDTWGVSLDEQVPTLNELYRATQLSGGSVEALMEQVGGADDVLSTLGFSLTESIALFSSFEKGGVDAQKAMAGLTKGFKFFVEKGSADPAASLKQFITELEKAPLASELWEKAFKVFGGKASMGMIDAIKEHRFNYSAMLEEIKNGGGTIEEAAAKNKTFGEQLSEAFNKVNISMAKSLGPDAFKGLGEGLAFVGEVAATLVGTFSKLPPVIQGITISFLGLLAVLPLVSFYYGQILLAGSALAGLGARVAASFAAAPVAAASTALVVYNAEFAAAQVAHQSAMATMAGQVTVWGALGAAVSGAASILAGVGVGLFAGVLLSGADVVSFFEVFIDMLKKALPAAWEFMKDAASASWSAFVNFFLSEAERVRTDFLWLLETLGFGPEQISKVTKLMSEAWTSFANTFLSIATSIRDTWQGLQADFVRGVGVLGNALNSDKAKQWAADELALMRARKEGNEAQVKAEQELRKEKEKTSQQFEEDVAKAKKQHEELVAQKKRLAAVAASAGLTPPPSGSNENLETYFNKTKEAIKGATKAIQDFGKSISDQKLDIAADKIKESVEAAVKLGGSKADLTLSFDTLESQIADKYEKGLIEGNKNASPEQLSEFSKLAREKAKLDIGIYKDSVAKQQLEVDKDRHTKAVTFLQGAMQDMLSGTRFDWVEQMKKASIEIASEWLVNLIEANILGAESFGEAFNLVISSLSKAFSSWLDPLTSSFGGSSGDLLSTAGSYVGDWLGMADSAMTLSAAFDYGAVEVADAGMTLATGLDYTATAATAAGDAATYTLGTTLDLGAATGEAAASTAAMSSSMAVTASALGAVAVGAYTAYSNYKKFSKWDGATSNETKTANVITAAIDTIFPGIGTAIDAALGYFGISFGSALTKNQQSLKGFEKWAEDGLSKSLGEAVNFAIGDINKFDNGGWADTFWAEFGDRGADTFSTLGIAFEHLLGLEPGVGGQIGALLAQNLAGANSFESLDNIKLFMDSIGISTGEMVEKLLELANAADISWFEFESMRQQLEKIPTVGLAAFGDMAGAFDQVLQSGGDGRDALIALRNVAVEAGEAGVASFAQLRDYLLSAGYAAQEVDAMIQAFGQRGITSFEELLNASDPALGGVIADMQTLGVIWDKFTEGTEQLENSVKNLADAIRDLSNNLRDIPRDIETNINVSTSGSGADSLGAFAKGGVINGPTVFRAGNGIGLMGEAGPEAIMPLKMVGGRLGVSTDGLGGGGNYIINIDATGAQAGVEHSILAAMESLRRESVVDAVNLVSRSGRREVY